MKKILLTLCAMAFSTPAFALEQFTLYGGAFDVTQSDDEAGEIGAEYRGADMFYGARPVVGLMVTTDKATYGYAGVHWDIPITDSIIFSPNFVAGAFSQGDGKDLGYGLEFKSGIELAYQFESDARLGVAFNHISNASLGNDNPGTENLILTYSHPVVWFGE